MTMRIGQFKQQQQQQKYRFPKPLLLLLSQIIIVVLLIVTTTINTTVTATLHDGKNNYNQHQQNEQQLQQHLRSSSQQRRLSEAIRIHTTTATTTSTTDDVTEQTVIGNNPTLSASIIQKDLSNKVEIYDDGSNNHNNNENNNNNEEIIIIPKLFQSYDKDYVIETQNYKSFPRWLKCDNTDSLSCIPVIDSIIDFIVLQNIFYENYLNKQYDTIEQWYNLPMNRTLDHQIFTTVLGWWPETLYILSNDGLYSSTTALNVTSQWHNGPNMYTEKKKWTDNIMIRAHTILLGGKNDDNDHDDTSSDSEQYNHQRWPLLYKTIVQEKQSIPFLVHYSDYTGCNYHNWNNGIVSSSIPLFTVAGTVDCSHTFPFPNSYDHTKPTVQTWIDIFKHQYEYYGNYTERIPRVIWRGSFTGYFNETSRPPRYNLLKFVHGLQNDTERHLFDIHCNYFSAGAKQYLTQEEVDTELGGIANYWIPEQDFQWYKAVLDIDGHSWSSRFGNLLCTSSIVLKVQPNYVDYFYYPKNESLRLIPWKHYIPIQSNFIDLVDKARYVMDPANEQHVQQIINNANQWCIDRMTPEIVATDALDIWESYLRVLNNDNSDSDSSDNNRVDNSEWMTKWNTISSSVLGSNHPQQMQMIRFT